MGERVQVSPDARFPVSEDLVRRRVWSEGMVLRSVASTAAPKAVLGTLSLSLGLV